MKKKQDHAKPSAQVKKTVIASGVVAGALATGSSLASGLIDLGVEAFSSTSLTSDTSGQKALSGGSQNNTLIARGSSPSDLSSFLKKNKQATVAGQQKPLRSDILSSTNGQKKDTAPQFPKNKNHDNPTRVDGGEASISNAAEAPNSSINAAFNDAADTVKGAGSLLASGAAVAGLASALSAINTKADDKISVTQGSESQNQSKGQDQDQAQIQVEETDSEILNRVQKQLMGKKNWYFPSQQDELINFHNYIQKLKDSKAVISLDKCNLTIIEPNLYINQNGDITFPRGKAIRQVDLKVRVQLGKNSVDVGPLKIRLQPIDFIDIQKSETVSVSETKQETTYYKPLLSLNLSHNVTETVGNITEDYSELSDHLSYAEGDSYSVKMHSTNFFTKTFTAAYNGPFRLLLLNGDTDEWGCGISTDNAFFAQKAGEYDPAYLNNQQAYGGYNTELGYGGRNYWCLGREYLFWLAYVCDRGYGIQSLLLNFVVGINFSIANETINLSPVNLKISNHSTYEKNLIKLEEDLSLIAENSGSVIFIGYEDSDVNMAISDTRFEIKQSQFVLKN